MKSFFFIVVLCSIVGCCHEKESVDCIHAILLSETKLLVQGEEILFSDGYWSVDKIIQQIQPVMGWDLSDTEKRTVLLEIRGDVNYGEMWFIVRALNRTGCAVKITSGKSAPPMRVLTRDSFQDCDYYLMDDVEMRSFETIEKSVPYSIGKASVAAQKILLEKREANPIIAIRCYMFMNVKDFLEVLSVAKGKGYDGVNLVYPLAVNVARGVDDYLKGEDGL